MVEPLVCSNTGDQITLPSAGGLHQAIEEMAGNKIRIQRRSGVRTPWQKLVEVWRTAMPTSQQSAENAPHLTYCRTGGWPTLRSVSTKTTTRTSAINSSAGS